MPAAGQLVSAATISEMWVMHRAVGSGRVLKAERSWKMTRTMYAAESVRPSPSKPRPPWAQRQRVPQELPSQNHSRTQYSGW